MHACEPRHRTEYGPIFPSANNDNLPPELRPRTPRQMLAWALSEPGAFALSLFVMGAVAMFGYTVAAAIAALLPSDACASR